MSECHDHDPHQDHAYLHAHGIAHTHAHVHQNQKAVINRLSRAIGHLEKVKRMVEEGYDCSEVLIQLAAVRSALDNTGKVILKDHMRHCMVDAVAAGDQDAIDDKNRISVNTANFINERLIIIEQELGGVESQIAAFKSHNRLTDIASQTGTFMEASSRYQQEGVAIEGQLALTNYIRDYLVDPTKSNELIPSNTGISDVNIEGQISQYNAVGDADRVCEKVMDSLMPSLRDAYDYIIIDCGLKHELLTVNALAASDYCIIPVQSHFLASEGVPDVLDMVRSVKEKFNPRLEVAGILLTMYQTRPQLCRSVRESVVDIYGGSYHVFERPIEYSIKVAECPAAGQSIFEYAPKNAAAESYRSLAREVLRLG